MVIFHGKHRDWQGGKKSMIAWLKNINNLNIKAPGFIFYH
jgi:hypothetical protein